MSISVVDKLCAAFSKVRGVDISLLREHNEMCPHRANYHFDSRAEYFEGKTILQALCELNVDRGIVAFWLSCSGVDPNTLNTDGTSPLGYLIQNRRWLTATLLLEQGADPNVGLDKKFHTPFSRAVGAGSFDMVKMMLNRGASIAGDPECRITPFHVACSRVLEIEGSYYSPLEAERVVKMLDEARKIEKLCRQAVTSYRTKRTPSSSSRLSSKHARTE